MCGYHYDPTGFLKVNLCQTVLQGFSTYVGMTEWDGMSCGCIGRNSFWHKIHNNDKTLYTNCSAAV